MILNTDWGTHLEHHFGIWIDSHFSRGWTQTNWSRTKDIIVQEERAPDDLLMSKRSTGLALNMAGYRFKTAPGSAPPIPHPYPPHARPIEFSHFFGGHRQCHHHYHHHLCRISLSISPLTWKILSPQIGNVPPRHVMQIARNARSRSVIVSRTGQVDQSQNRTAVDGR